MKRMLAAGLVLLALAGRTEDRIYQGHYASGIAKYTVKGAHVYEGHYASGISAWTTGDASGSLHIYQGHYASGISKWTYRDGHLYQGHYASGISKWTYRDGHVYEGHYASGISKFTFRNGHVYRGHYASGISAWTFKSTDDVPDGLLVFLVTQILEPAAAVPDPPVPSPVEPPVVVPVEPPVVAPVVPPAPEPVVPDVWKRARTLQGVLEADGAVVGSVEVKCGRIDRRGLATVSVAATPFLGRKRTFRGRKAVVRAGVTDVEWPEGGLRIELGETSFRAWLGTGETLRSASVGGALSPGGHRLTVRRTGAAATLPGFALDETRLPADVAFAADGSRWTFPKDEPSRVRLSYVPAKGVFRGTFKAGYAPEADASGRARVRTVSVKVAGLVVDGAGAGAAASSRPAQSYSVAVE